jgi:hypothetical protein
VQYQTPGPDEIDWRSLFPDLSSSRRPALRKTKRPAVVFFEPASFQGMV